MSEFINPEKFNIEHMICDLDLKGGSSLHILRESRRQILLEEAQGYQFRDTGFGKGIGFRKVFSPDSNYWVLKVEFEELINSNLSSLQEYPFSSKLDLNYLELLQYQRGCANELPIHRDGNQFMNLICSFIIGGNGRFFTYIDNRANRPHELNASPGQVIILRAPGFRGSDKEIWHDVRQIEVPRYTFTLRQL